MTEDVLLHCTTLLLLLYPLSLAKSDWSGGTAPLTGAMGLPLPPSGRRRQIVGGGGPCVPLILLRPVAR